MSPAASILLATETLLCRRISIERMYPLPGRFCCGRMKASSSGFDNSGAARDIRVQLKDWTLRAVPLGTLGSCRNQIGLLCKVIARPRRLSSGATPQSAKDHGRHRAVHDLAHGETRLDPRHPRQPGELGSVNALEVLDMARHHN